MSNGVYGTRIPANINQDDIEIYYTYRQDLNSTDDSDLIFKRLSSNILVKSSREIKDGEIDSVMEGMYDLHLPLQHFNKKGFYTIYIKPREIKAVITDVGVLSSYPDVRGIVVDMDKVETGFRYKFFENNGLVGYRVIYINPQDGSRQEYYRIVTSNNRCEPLTQSLQDSNKKTISYRYNDSSSLTFITLTPSTAPTFKANATPFIGNISQQVLFVNTKFEPLMIELEMVDHDADTISTMLEGEQVRDLENGIVTTFNQDKEIYHQSEHYTLKNEYTTKPIYEVKKNKNSDIDFTQQISDK